MKKVLGIGLGSIAGLIGAGSAYAVDFYTAPTIDTAVLGTMATSILAALALLWAVRKGVKMINRS